jgi:hypothetical protein
MKLKGVKILPDSERLTRELLMYPEADRIRLWKYTQRRAAIEDRSADSRDIREAAVKVLGSEYARLRQFAELLKSVQGIARAMRKHCTDITWDALEQHEIKRLKEPLIEIALRALLALKRIPKGPPTYEAAMRVLDPPQLMDK